MDLCERVVVFVRVCVPVWVRGCTSRCVGVCLSVYVVSVCVSRTQVSRRWERVSVSVCMWVSVQEVPSLSAGEREGESLCTS